MILRRRERDRRTLPQDRPSKYWPSHARWSRYLMYARETRAHHEFMMHAYVRGHYASLEFFLLPGAILAGVIRPRSGLAFPLFFFRSPSTVYTAIRLCIFFEEDLMAPLRFSRSLLPAACIMHALSNAPPRCSRSSLSEQEIVSYNWSDYMETSVTAKGRANRVGKAFYRSSRPRTLEYLRLS